MKNFLRISMVALIFSATIIACQDDNDADPARDGVAVSGSDAVSAFRGTTATVSVNVTSAGGTPTLTANGNALTIGADGSATFDVEVPEGDPVGTTYDVEFVATNGTVSDEFTVTVTLAAGPAVTPNLEPLVNIFSDFSQITAETIVSSDDVLDTWTTTGGFQLGGSADGAGMVVNPETGNYELLVNCEDHYSVVRVTLDSDLKPLKGDYLLNSSVADFARQCSGTLWEADIHGGAEDFYISSSETFNYQSRRIDPLIAGEDIAPGVADNLVALGEFGWENNVPLPQESYPGQTVIIGGDDDSGSFAGDAEGQVALYYSDQGDADLAGGKVYVLRLASGEAATEGDIAFGEAVAVEFVEVTGSNVDEYDQAAADVNTFRFMRVEDLDYGKGSAAAGRTIYFAVTGRGPGRGTYNDWGTGYKLVLDEDSPLTGTMTQILSGNTDTNNMDGNLAELQSPDNIVVTENYVYWQEDPNSFSRGHQAYIWQTDLDGNNPQAILEIAYDADLDAVDGNLDSDQLNGEFGAMVDISDKVGEDGTFILCLQPHYWRDEAYSAIDGHDLMMPPGFPGEDNQGSQVVVLRNVPR